MNQRKRRWLSGLAAIAMAVSLVQGAFALQPEAEERDAEERDVVEERITEEAVSAAKTDQAWTKKASGFIIGSQFQNATIKVTIPGAKAGKTTINPYRLSLDYSANGKTLQSSLGVFSDTFYITNQSDVPLHASVQVKATASKFTLAEPGTDLSGEEKRTASCYVVFDADNEIKRKIPDQTSYADAQKYYQTYPVMPGKTVETMFFGEEGILGVAGEIPLYTGFRIFGDANTPSGKNAWTGKESMKLKFIFQFTPTALREWEYWEDWEDWDNTDDWGSVYNPHAPQDPIYAFLYDDGTMTFQNTNSPDTTKTLKATYDAANLRYIDEYGGSNYRVSWRDEAENIKKVDFLEKIRPRDVQLWFDGCANLKEIAHIENLDTSRATDMTMMFSGCGQLTYLDLSSFDTKKVRYMVSMFNGCENLICLDLSSFDTSNVEMVGMAFMRCGKLETIYASDKFNVSHIPDIYSEGNPDYGEEPMLISDDMFANCTSLVGGSGTRYSDDHPNKDYAHIDGGTSNPGYFTAKET